MGAFRSPLEVFMLYDYAWFSKYFMGYNEYRVIDPIEVCLSLYN